MAYDRTDWSQHYEDGNNFRPLSDAERDLLAQHAPATDHAHALDIGCGTGELATHLASHGYDVDAVDYADGALARAHAQHQHVESVRWLCLDIEHDDPAVLRDEGYDLITMRLMYPFIGDRTGVLHALAGRLRPGGALIVITPLASHTAPDRRPIALDDEEITQLTSGWQHAQQYSADDLALIVMRGPQSSFEAVEKGHPPPTEKNFTAPSSATRKMQQEQIRSISRLTPLAAEFRSEQIARGFIESGQEPVFLLESANFQDDYTLVCADRYWRMRIEASPTCETAALCARWLYTHTGALTPAQVETVEEQWSLGLGFIASSYVQSPDEVENALHSNRNANREKQFSALFHAGKLRANYRFGELRAHMKRFRSARAGSGLTDRPIVLALHAFASLGEDEKPDAGLHLLRWAWENRSTRTTADVCLNALGAAKPFPEQGQLLRAYAKEVASEHPADHAAHYWLASGHYYAHDHVNALDSIDRALALLPARGARGSHALIREQHLSLRHRISQALRQF